MQVGTLPPARKIEPELLGPLGGETLQQTTPPELFPGEDRFLSKSQRSKRVEIWRSLSPLLGRFLAQDEHVLYVAQGVLRPGGLHAATMGALSFRYHQVVLIFTGARLIEVLLDFRGHVSKPRIRSFPWPQVAGIKLSWGSLRVVCGRKKKTTWSLSTRGDKKLLKLLVPRLQERLHPAAVATAVEAPVWHCTECLSGTPARPRHCPTCGTLFRSFKMASLLSLAFPGAGLLYCGHPVLALSDFLGEALLFGLFGSMLATASGSEALYGAVAALVIGFIVTKFESIHVGHLLTSFARSETPARRAGWKKFGAVGGLVSAVAMAALVPLAGKFAAGVDRDLDFAGLESTWSGTRNPSEWRFFENESSLRSQWTHEDGWVVSVFAYPLGQGDTPEKFWGEFSAGMEAQGATHVVSGDQVPAPLKGYRHVSQMAAKDGSHTASINYFVYDPQGRDIHHLLVNVVPEEGRQAEARVKELLGHARWTDAAPPTR